MARHVRALSKTITDNIQDSTHVIADVGQKAVQHILHYDQLPEWMKADPYIKLGYRRQLNSFSDCFWSLFYLHNELVNIWSHLLPGFLYSTFLLGYDFWTFHNGIEVSNADTTIFQLYIICQAGCLILSALYHCANSYSEPVSRYFLKFDYFGIELSIIGTNVSTTYFGLYGNLHLQEFYIVFILVCSAIVFYFLLRDDFDGPNAALRRYLSLYPYPHLGDRYC